MMKAAAFVRYRSGDGAGHVAWAFDVDGARAVAGSVENHSGHMFTPATEMGFWAGLFPDPAVPMRERAYDDAKWLEVRRPNPLAAYRTMLWIEHQAYHAIHRNCEDDVYDVLRSYGVKNLPPPLWHWFPKGWFRSLRGSQVPVAHLEWDGGGKPHDPEAARALSERFRHATPRRPSWRSPWHPHFHLLRLAKVARSIRHLLTWARSRKR